MESLTEHPELAFALSNCRPAHGAPGNRCPVCLQYCNQLRGGYSAERARRLIAERSGKREPPRKPDSQPDAGRPWLAYDKVSSYIAGRHDMANPPTPTGPAPGKGAGQNGGPGRGDKGGSASSKNGPSTKPGGKPA